MRLYTHCLKQYSRYDKSGIAKIKKSLEKADFLIGEKEANIYFARHFFPKLNKKDVGYKEKIEAITYISKRYRELRDNLEYANKSDLELIQVADEEVTALRLHHGRSNKSKNKLPDLSSSKKYRIRDFLKQMPVYKTLYLFCLEDLTRENGYLVEMETKMLIDWGSVKKNILLNNLSEWEKVERVRQYCEEQGHNVKTKRGNMLQVLAELKHSTKRCLVYINGAGYETQRPRLILAIREKLPNATVVMVMADVYRFGQQIEFRILAKELTSIYGISNIYKIGKKGNKKHIRKDIFNLVLQSIQAQIGNIFFVRYGWGGKQKKCLAFSPSERDREYVRIGRHYQPFMRFKKVCSG